jgi:ankyrin repeat protein
MVRSILYTHPQVINEADKMGHYALHFAVKKANKTMVPLTILSPKLESSFFI